MSDTIETRLDLRPYGDNALVEAFKLEPALAAIYRDAVEKSDRKILIKALGDWNIDNTEDQLTALLWRWMGDLQKAKSSTDFVR
jgi:hypothetical protein